MTRLLLSALLSEGPVWLLAVLGGSLARRGGWRFFALEGCIILGGGVGWFLSLCLSIASGLLLPLILLCAALSGGCLALLFGALSRRASAAMPPVGVALHGLVLCLFSLLLKKQSGTAVLPVVQVQRLFSLTLPFGQTTWLLPVSLLLLPAMGLLLRFTSLGRRLLLLEQAPIVLWDSGSSPRRLRFLCLFLGGLFSGLAGLAFAAGRASWYVPEGAQGLGCLALALTYVCGGRLSVSVPLGLVFCCLVPLLRSAFGLSGEAATILVCLTACLLLCVFPRGEEEGDAL